MSKKKMKRIVCAGLAAQMMLSSVAQAADPLRDLFDTSMPISAAEQAILSAKTAREGQDEALMGHVQKLSLDMLTAHTEPVEMSSADGEELVPQKPVEGTSEGWTTTETGTEKLPVGDISDAELKEEDSQSPDAPSDDGEMPSDGVTIPSDESLETLPDDMISDDKNLPVGGGEKPEDGDNDLHEELPAEGEFSPTEELDPSAGNVPDDKGEASDACVEEAKDGPAYFSSEYPGAPIEPVIKYLLKINGYDTKYNYSGDGTKWVQGTPPDYNVEQEEPWIEYENFDYSGGVLTQLIEPATEIDENTDIWAGIDFPDGFDAHDETTWPDWYARLIESFATFGDSTLYEIFWQAEGDETWPEPEKIPTQFDPRKQETLPGQSMGMEVWRPDENFVWDDESSLTYFRGDLSTPRVPNMKFDGWYIPDLDRNSPLGPAAEPYGKYGGPDGPDTNPFVDNGNVTAEFRYESDPALPRYAPEYADEYTAFDPAVPMDDYTYYMGHDRVLAIIGSWVDSDNATATNLALKPADGGIETTALYPYEEGIENLTADELTKKTAIATEDDFARVSDHLYFARVPFETTKLNFSLYTYEPASTLEITATNSGGQVISFTEWVDQKGETRERVNGYPNNSATNPARGIRSLKEMEIPLATTSAENRYTVISMTVTAPDGKSQETYTVYVQRLAQPKMVVAPGNTPYGMIDRTPGWSDDKKNSVKNNIRDHGKFVVNTSSGSALDFPNDGSNIADSGINNGGFVYAGIYVSEAWGHNGTNYDRDSGAIVVYQNATFQVPGFTVYDSMYNSHTEGEQGLKVSWDLTMTLVDTLGPAAAQDAPAGIGTESYTWEGEGTVGQISLHGYSVKPGVYTMIYTFQDPYDYIYHRDGHSEAEQGFTRTVIVLPLRGDVDMDGEVTPADGVMLQQLLESNYFGENRTAMVNCTDVAKCLYYFRVCDVNGDGDINHHDTESLLSGYDSATYGPNEASRAYYQYLPLLDPAKDENKPEAGKAETGTAIEGKVNLEVTYLGFSTDANDIENPDKWDKTNSLDYYPNDSTHPNVFWMGVKLTGTENLPESLKAPLTTFTFTLAYDGSYAEPWSSGDVNWLNYIKSVNPQWDWTEYTLQDSSGIGIVPAVHDGKAASNLEAGKDLRELRFSLVGSGMTLQELEQSGYILKVPFRLTSYPRVRMDEDKNASLVEAALGMRDMMLTTSETVSDDLGYPVKASAVWKNQDSQQLYPENVTTTTINLANQMVYVVENAEIPIGKDNTPSVGILTSKGVRPVYGEYFEADLTNTVDGAGNPVYLGTPVRVEDNGELQKAGLSFDLTTRKLTGTPNRTWSEDDALNFYIVTQGEHQYPFTLIVEKAPLTLTVQSASKYYGETEIDRQVFTYNTQEIKFNSEGGKTNTGAAEDLPNLLSGYKAPTIELVESVESNKPVTAGTVPGSYVVKISGGESDNYQFKYIQNGAEIPYDSYGTATLTVRPRPIFVDTITKRDENGNEITLGILSAGSQTTAVQGQISYQKQEFTAAAVTDLQNGHYEGIPLTTSIVVIDGDEVTLQYTANTTDLSNPSTPSVDRDATVTNVTLAAPQEGNKNNCYTLAGNAPLKPAGKITVTRQKLFLVDVEAAPADMTFDYGAELTVAPLLIAFYFDDDRAAEGNTRRVPITGDWDEEFVENYYRSDGLTFQWVDQIYEGNEVKVDLDKKYVYKMSPVDGEFPDDAASAYTGQIMTVGEQNGKYLCLSVPGVNETTGENIVHRIYFGPYTVNPKELTLTVEPNYRYYGEPNDSTPWNVSFDRTELTLGDQAKLNTAKGNRADLKRILGEEYVEPTAEFHTANNLTSDVVTEKTSVGQYYLLLTGGKSDDYTFRYVCTSQSGATTTTGDADAPGYAPMEIYPRPILVTGITAPVVELSPDSTFPGVNTDYVAIVDAATSKSEFSAELPTYRNEYWMTNIDGGVETRINYALSGAAVCSWDKLSLQYRAESIERHNENSPYWNLQGNNSINIKVEVHVLSIQNNNNYVLVYGSKDASGHRYTALADGTRTSAYGTVSERMVSKVELTDNLPDLEYTYGDTFNFHGFTINVWYDGKEDGKGKPVLYSVQTSAEYPNSFLREGLDVYWLNDDGSLGETVTQGQQLSVAEHNGKKIAVAKRNGDILATVTTNVTVQKKTLHLTAKDQRRIYGEENERFVAELPISELASWDRTTLGLAADASGKVDSARLEELDTGYENGSLVFTTKAVKTSGVGTYALTLSAQGAGMANYALEAAGGTITVVKRRLMVESIVKDPVYSVSQGAKVTTIAGIKLYQGKDSAGHVSDTVTTYNDLVLRAVGYDGLIPTASVGVLPEDLVGIQMDVTFTGSTADITDHAPVTISPNSFQLILGGDNYEIQNSGMSLTANGQVHRRRVEFPSVFNGNGVISTTYVYGQTLDLSAMQLRLTYEKEPGESDEDVASKLVSYKDFEENGISVYYWDKASAPSSEELKSVLEDLDQKGWNADSGDLLTRVEKNGLSHHGKYLLIVVKTTPDAAEYSRPLVYGNPVTGAKISLTVNQRELTYTFRPTTGATEGRVDDKPYDRTTQATGTLVLAQGGNNGVVGNDNVSVDVRKLKFTFLTADAGVDKPVEVSGIELIGDDKDNYAINSEVRVGGQYGYGRPGTPVATINPYTERFAPDIVITLSVDEHTNKVTVHTDKAASDLADNAKDKAEYRYEYALVDKDGNFLPNQKGELDYQSSPVFGGEEGQQEPGVGALPRGTYVGALVRLARTNNYTATEPTRSYTDFQADQEAAEAGLPIIPEDEKVRIVERNDPGPVVKTYTYRIDLIATEEQKGSDGKSTYETRLETVWFTDIAALGSEKELDRLVDNLSTTRYTAYGWNPSLSVKLRYPMDLTQPIIENLPVEQEDGTTQQVETEVNKGNILPIYVTAKPRPSGGSSGGYYSPRKVKIEPDGLILHLGEAPVQLELIFEPDNVTDREVTWTSSDELVVTVSEDGVVTAMGLGTAVITVTTWNHRTDSIIVQVVEGYDIPFRDTMFNANYQGSYMELFEGYFQPERLLTRRELTIIMEHFFQRVEQRQPSQPDIFLDVPEKADYAEQVQTLNIWGIVNGVGEDLYAPGQYATRAEISAILCRMLMLPINTDPEGPHAFLDAGPEDTWAWAYIDALAKAGITLGVGDEMYAPNRILTRAEVATMLSRALVTDVDIDGADVIVPLDVTEEHWAYRHILRAVNSGAVLMVKSKYRKK